MRLAANSETSRRGGNEITERDPRPSITPRRLTALAPPLAPGPTAASLVQAAATARIASPTR